MLLQNNDIILFQGDSITDAGRDYADRFSLGYGYPLMIASRLGHLFPEMQFTFLNRGISGDRVIDLQNRWDQDCLNLQPDWVSIYIGINDTWRRYDEGEITTTEQFEAGYRDLLNRTVDKLDAKIIMIEPFVLPVPEDRRIWREDLDPKITVVRDLAREFGARLVPLDGLFAQASVRAEPSYWAPDGVHPSPAGHGLITDGWIRSIGITF